MQGIQGGTDPLIPIPNTLFRSVDAKAGIALRGGNRFTQAHHPIRNGIFAVQPEMDERWLRHEVTLKNQERILALYTPLIDHEIVIPAQAGMTILTVC